MWSRLRGQKVKEDINQVFIPDDPRYQRIFANYLGLFYQIDRMARARGGMLVDRPLDERMVFIARGLLKYNPYAQGYINILRTYTLGSRGFRHEIQGSNTRLNQEAQEYLDKFKNMQHGNAQWWGWERDYFDRVHIEGEAFVRYYETEDCITIRPIEPEWILPNSGEIDWTFGCHNVPGDVHNIDMYHVWYGTENEDVDAREVVHIKSKLTPLCLKRGWSDFQTSCQILDDSFKCWKNYLQSEAVRQAIIYFSKQAEGVSISDIDAAIAGQADYAPPSSAVERQIPPTKLTMGAGVEFLAAGTELNAVPSPEAMQGTVAGVNAALLAAGRQYQMPLWLLSGDMGQNNVVDLGHESPFGASIADEQIWYSEQVRRVLWRVLELGAEYEHISPEILERCKLCVDTEQRPPRDIKAASERLKMLAEDGIIAKRTRTTQEGFDYDAEQEQIEIDGDADKQVEDETVDGDGNPDDGEIDTTLEHDNANQSLQNN